MAWGKNGTPSTGSGASLTISDLTKNKLNQFMCHILQNGNVNLRYRIGNGSIDTGSNYADRLQYNGGTDILQTSQTDIHLTNATASDIFSIVYLINISGEEKLIIGHHLNSQGTGAGSAPNRMESVNKYTVTTDQIDQLQALDESGTEIGSNSNLSALGSEITPAAAIPFAENAQLGSRAEITDTRKVYNHIIPSLTFEEDFSSDNWTTSSSTYIGIDTTTDNEMDFNNPSSLTGQHHSYYDLGLDNVSDTKWVLRWKWEITTISENSDGTPHDTAVGISNNTVGYNTAQDALTLRFRESSTNDKKISLKSANDPEIIFGGATDADFTTKFSVSTFYCELKRTSATSYTANIYSDSSYSTLTESQTGTCSSSITGLRYLKVGLNNNDGTANGQVSGHIDDVKFYNGVTETTNYWQEIGA